MKKIAYIMVLGFLFLGSASQAVAAWNTYPSDCPLPLSIGNYSTGYGIQDGSNGCWTKTSVTASAGQTINIAVYYDNTNNTAANNTVIQLTQSPAGSMSTANSSYAFSGSLNSSAGSLNLSQVTANLSTAQTLTFSQARWYKAGSASSTALPNGQTGYEAFGGGLNMGTIANGDWGTVLMSFTVGTTVTPPPVVNCTISNFTANGTSISANSSSTLSWNTSNCTSVSISGIGNVSTSGSQVVYPSTTTTYTLTAYGQNGAPQTRTVTVTVASYVPPVQNCTISNFTANPTSISANSSSTLSWNTSNCISVTISNLGYNVPVSGNQVIYPTQTTTYLLTAYGSNWAEQTRSVTITVASYVPPVQNCTISNFTANPTQLSGGGQQTNLTWNTNNCTSANISGIGSVAVSGSQNIYPSDTTTYTLTAYGINGTSQTRSVTVTVASYIPPTPIINCAITNFTASPTSIISGSGATLVWNTSGCTNVSILNSNLFYYVAPTSGTEIVYPTTTTTYTLTAYGSNWVEQTRSVTVTVATGYVPPVQNCTISDFTANGTSISANGSSTLSWNTNNCASATISNLPYNVPVSGNQVIYPTATTTYTLTAYGINGTSQTRSVTVTVASYIPPTTTANCSISNFNANTNNVNVSNPVTLTWNTANCTNANISNIGSVAIAGSQTVYPNQTTTYTLTAYGSNWAEQTRSVTVVVNNYIPGIVNNCIISSFYASPTSINSNNYSSLYWTTNNCTSVTISNLGYNVPLSGNQTVYPNQTTTYTLTAYGSNGSAQNQTATISVINTNNNQSCYISNFTASPSVVTSGSPVTLNWNTNGCTSANINGIGNVALSGNQTIYPTYSTNYILNAYGYNNTQQSQTAYVAVNPVVVVQPPIQQPVYNVCAVTTIATNVGQNSAQLNGLITSGTGSMTTYFEYGPTVSMGYRTQSRSVNANSSFNEFISGLAPDTIYYFRFISTCANGAQSQGTIEIFETLRTPTVSSNNRNQQTTVVRPVIVQGTTVIGTSSPIMLKIENRYEAIGIGDTIDYTVTYKNIGSSLLTRPILQVIAPKGITLTNASRGTYAPDTNTLTVELEDLYPNAEGVVFIQGRVDSMPVNTAQIVTTAVLVYTSPSGAQENAIAYVLNKPKDIFNNNNLGASAFFAGIFPSTLIGWLLLLILILLLILLTRRYYPRQQTTTHTTVTPPHY